MSLGGKFLYESTILSGDVLLASTATTVGMAWLSSCATGNSPGSADIDGIMAVGSGAVCGVLLTSSVGPVVLYRGVVAWRRGALVLPRAL